MQTDPAIDPGQGTDDQGTGAAGAPTPNADAALKQENAQLREELREAKAKELSREHGLTATQTELVSQQPRDKQEELAKRLAAENTELKGQAQAPAPTGDPAPTADPAQTAAPAPAEEPADAAGLAAMGTGGDGPAAPAAPAPGTLEDQMNAEVKAIAEGKSTKSFADVQQHYAGLIAKRNAGE